MRPEPTISIIEIPGYLLTWDGHALRRGIVLILTHHEVLGTVLRGAFRDLSEEGKAIVTARMAELGVDVSTALYDVEVLAGLRGAL